MRFMLFDRWGSYVSDLGDVRSAVRSRATDATDTLDVVTGAMVAKDDRIVFRDSLGRWCEYVVRSVDVQRADGMPVTTAYCSGSIAELSRAYIVDVRNRGAYPADCLAKALAGTRWSLGEVGAGSTPTADLAFYHMSVLSAIQSITDTYGLELSTRIALTPDKRAIARRIVDLPARRGSASVTRRFEYGRDLTGIRRTVDASDVITRLYGWGKGIEQTDDEGDATGGYSRKIDFSSVNHGLKYVEDAAATAAWGMVGPDGSISPSVGDAEFPDDDDPSVLLAHTKARLLEVSKPVVSYEADVAALGRAGLDADGVDVGDSVHIVDTTFTPALRLEGRVLKLEEDLVGPLSDAKITLGNITQSYTQRSARVQQALDQLTGHASSWDSAATLGNDYLNDVISGLNGIMNATGGYTYIKPGQGLYVYDRPEDQNPTMAIQLGGGYLRIADGRKSNGDWDWRTLGNGHGLVADALYTGIINAANVSIRSSTSNNYVGLDGNGVTAYKNGTPYAHMGADAANGFTLLDTGSGRMRDISRSVFNTDPLFAVAAQSWTSGASPSTYNRSWSPDPYDDACVRISFETNWNTSVRIDIGAYIGVYIQALGSTNGTTIAVPGYSFQVWRHNADGSNTLIKDQNMADAVKVSNAVWENNSKQTVGSSVSNSFLVTGLQPYTSYYMETRHCVQAFCANNGAWKFESNRHWACVTPLS
jgi:phage minor structural protein